MIYFLCLPLLLTTTLHLHHVGWWLILCTPSGSFITNIKDVYIYQYIFWCYLNQSLVEHHVNSGTIGIWKFPHGSPCYCYRTEVLTCSYLIIRVHQPYPSMVWGTCMCLYVLLLVNKSHYWLLWMEGKKETCIVKLSIILQEKWVYHENYCLLC